MKLGRWLIFGLWTLGAAGLFLAGDPSLTGEAALRLLRGLGGVFVWAVAALGAGQAVVGWATPALRTDPRGWAHAAVAGLLLWGLGGLGLAALGMLDSPGFIGLAALLSSGWLRPAGIPLPRRPEAGTLLAVGLLLLPGLVTALAPPVDTDELYYQLALPRRMLDSGGLLGGAWSPDGSRPMILHLPYAALLWAGGEAAPRLFHLGIAVALLLLVEALARAHGAPSADEGPVARPLGQGLGLGLSLGPLLLAASWSVIQEAGLAANNLPVAFVVLAAVDAGLRGSRAALALAAGLALSMKYTAAGPLLGAFLFSRLPLSGRAQAGLAALALISPWWVRNLLDGLHPLFPYAGWAAVEGASLRFQYLEKYGAGRAPTDLLLAPLRAVMSANIGTFRFLGKLSPGWIAALPLLALGGSPAMLRLLGVGVVGLAAWTAGPHWIRHLLPVLPIFAVALSMAAARSLDRPMGLLLGAALLAGLPANLGPVVTTLADRLPVATGLEAREAFLSRRVEDWAAVAWINDHLPAEARLAVFFGWSGYYIERDYLLSSVEDHVPTRHFLLREGEGALGRLREAGVGYVLVERVGFLPSVYPFLSKADFQAQFVAPEALLDRLLLQQGTRVFQSGRASVWRLDAAAP